MQVKLVCFSKKRGFIYSTVKEFFESIFSFLIKEYNIKNKQVKDGFNSHHVGLFIPKKVFQDGIYVEKEFLYEAVEVFVCKELNREELQKTYHFIEFPFEVNKKIVNDADRLVDKKASYSFLSAFASANFGFLINKFLNFLRAIFVKNKKEVFCVSSALHLVLSNMSKKDFVEFHSYYTNYIKSNFGKRQHDLLFVLDNLQEDELLHKYEITNETDPAVLYNVLKDNYSYDK